MPIPAAHVAWYVTGRFYEDEQQQLMDLGYFLRLSGIEAPLFRDPAQPSEGGAYLTFRSAPFASHSVTNGNLGIGLDPVGTFDLYLNLEGGATFDDPDSFSCGQRIATFRRNGIAMVETLSSPQLGGLALSLNVFSASILHSSQFQLGGHAYDLRDLLPHGITQWGVASANPLATFPPYQRIVAFTGSAIAGGR